MTAPALSPLQDKLLKRLYLLQQDNMTARLPDLRQLAQVEEDAFEQLLVELQEAGLITDDTPDIHLTDAGADHALDLFFDQSESVENFLKAVYALHRDTPDKERVSTNALKDALSISAPSVTDMAQRLVDDGLVDYRKYYGVRLTDIGERVALKIIRRHRLIELYLVRELGYALHEVHDEAEALEHAVSDRFIQAITTKMENPLYDPHGDPIPAPDGTVPRRTLQPLSELPLNTPACISRLTATDAGMLAHTQSKGFTLSTKVMVTARDPFEGPLTVQLADDERVIGHMLAQTILVETLP